MSGSPHASGTLPVDSVGRCECACPGSPRPANTGWPPTPDAATKLRASGFDVIVERGAGVRAGFTDEQYTNAGITLVDHGQLLDGADAIVRVGKPTGEEIDGLPSGNRPDRLPPAADRH